MGCYPFAGMAWMHCQFLVGLLKLGHEVFYAETSSLWPYDPRKTDVSDDPTYTLTYLQRVLDHFGLGDRWSYRTAYADNAWYGPLRSDVDDLLRSADAVFNIAGSTRTEEIPVPCQLVHIGTDPVVQELRIASGNADLHAQLAAHHAHFTYGELIGTPASVVPPLPFSTRPMRQPVVLDFWTPDRPGRHDFTTVTNWEMTHHNVEFQGETYTWSKSHEFLKFLDLPRRSNAKFELGIGSVKADVARLLREHGWSVVDALQFSLDPLPYRDYIRNSGAEFTVAKDMNVRLQSGWFSERSACYLAAGRPVVTQDTGFSRILPTGEGLFAFHDMSDILTAVEAINSDYEHHSRAARSIAEQYFRAETVLAAVLDALGL